MKLERTCICTEDYDIEDLVFHKRREYQVDIYQDYYKVYQNGGWYDFICLSDDEFEKHFKLIE